MITVRFFGLLSVDSHIEQLSVKVGTIRQVLNEIKESCGFTEQQLLQAILFVNKKPVRGKRRFSMFLKDGDELVLISPASGG